MGSFYSLTTVKFRSDSYSPEEVVKKWVKKIGLDISKSYRLSWNDKYRELCNSQGVKQYNHVTFDLPMPQVIDYK